MAIAIVPLIVAIVGLLLWIYSEHPIAKESGRILFVIGVLILLLHMSSPAVKLY